MNYEKKIKEIFAARTGTNPHDWFYTFRAREAIEVISSNLGDDTGKCKIAIQPFTCSTVPEGIIAGNTIPIYKDILIDNLSLNPALLSEDTEEINAVFLQHTFGIVDQQNDAKLAKVAKEMDALLIEDSAHIIGTISKDEEGKPIADISIHSFGVEKILPTSFGAITWVNPGMHDKALREKIISSFNGLPYIEKWVEKATQRYYNQIRILGKLPIKLRRTIRRRWTEHHIFIPAIDDIELEGKTLFSPAKPTGAVLEKCYNAILSLDNILADRGLIVDQYLDNLVDSQNENKQSNYTIPRGIYKGGSLLWFPLIMYDNKDAIAIHNMLLNHGIYTSSWGRPLLFPGVPNEEAFSFFRNGKDKEKNEFPISVKCSEGLLLLPTNVPSDVANRVIEIVNDYYR